MPEFLLKLQAPSPIKSHKSELLFKNMTSRINFSKLIRRYRNLAVETVSWNKWLTIYPKLKRLGREAGHSPPRST